MSFDWLATFIVGICALVFIDGVMLSCLAQILSRVNLAINLARWALYRSNAVTPDEFRAALSFGIIPWWACIGVLMAAYECPLLYVPVALIGWHCYRILASLRRARFCTKPRT